MTTEKNITAQAMRQDVLNRLDVSRKAILELSDDELESIVGGGIGKGGCNPAKDMGESRLPRFKCVPSLRGDDPGFGGARGGLR